jgi:hypothetical protein
VLKKATLRRDSIKSFTKGDPKFTIHVSKLDNAAAVNTATPFKNNHPIDLIKQKYGMGETIVEEEKTPNPKIA